jgi:hypothetical protein
LNSSNIFNSKGIRVAVVNGTEVFSLSGQKLYEVKEAKIYRISGELGLKAKPTNTIALKPENKSDLYPALSLGAIQSPQIAIDLLTDFARSDYARRNDKLARFDQLADRVLPPPDARFAFLNRGPLAIAPWEKNGFRDFEALKPFS